jgi:hypothetical protein
VHLMRVCVESARQTRGFTRSSSKTRGYRVPNMVPSPFGGYSGAVGRLTAQPRTLEHADFRAFREQDVHRCGALEGGEGRAVERGEIGLDVEAADRIDGPTGMLDAVLGGVAARALGVAPVMLGDELFDAAGLDGLRGWRGFHGDALPDSFVEPGIADAERIGRGGDAAAHGDSCVRLLVKGVGRNGDRSTRHKLADEDDPALACAVCLGAGDIEAEVYFLEAGVERDSNALDADAVEKESNEGDVAAALVEIEFNAARKPGRERRWVNLILRHDQLAPLDSEKGAGHRQLLDEPSVRAVRQL